MGMCPSHDHRSFKATSDLIDEMRRIVDDLTADAISAWDALVEEVFASRKVPPGKMHQRLKQLKNADGPLHDLMTDVWDRLLKRLNDVRNKYQHNDFWKNSFGVAQGNGPFTMDIRAPVGATDVYVLRDLRRSAHAIVALHTAAKLPSTIPIFTNPCSGCGGDVFIGPPMDWVRLNG